MMDSQILESHADKIFRHSYAMVGKEDSAEFLEWIKEHEYYSKYTVKIDDEGIFYRIELQGKETYSY